MAGLNGGTRKRQHGLVRMIIKAEKRCQEKDRKAGKDDGRRRKREGKDEWSGAGVAGQQARALPASARPEEIGTGEKDKPKLTGGTRIPGNLEGRCDGRMRNYG